MSVDLRVASRACAIITNVVIVAVFVCLPASVQTCAADRLVRDPYGAIIRGDVSKRALALVFTGDEFGEGTPQILEALAKRHIKASFFVTGNFLRQPSLRLLVERAIAEGHYVGPHSDSHPLYASWNKRDKSLVTEEFFAKDLQRNIVDLRTVGALGKSQPICFIPPYEHYNRDQLRWSQKLGVTLFNFTPASGSNRDYTKEGDPHFVGARKIYDDILAYERKDSRGLNGFILLMHLGSGRKDPLHPLLGQLCDELSKRGYQFERVDRLLEAVSKP
jgi:peptidoglycan/xylan/chitin deacetylase (PgdA/CDA1 family)